MNPADPLTVRDVAFDEEVEERTDPAWSHLRPLAEIKARQRRWADLFDTLVAKADRAAAA
jgi:hypothetical protein